MTNLRTFLIALVAVAALVAACAGTSTQPSPSSSSPSAPPVGGTVDTPEKAIAAVVAHDPRFASIKPYDPNLIGQSAWYKVTPASGVGAYVVEIQVGWGDCQAGCIDRHTWTFAVLPDGTVNRQSETGAAIPSGIWPQPTGAGQTGIGGTALAGPTCAVQTIGDPACAPRPVVGAIIAILDTSGAEVAHGTTGADGGFFIAVGAGDYMVRAAPVDGLMGTPGPIATSVTAGSASVVPLDYDTGIR